MKHLLQQKRVSHLWRQRNIMMVGCVGLLVSNIILASIILNQNDHVIIVPPETKKEFWIERNRVSAGYLEEMTIFMSHLLLTVSPSSSAFQRDVILRYATPVAYSTLKTQLIEDETRLKKDNIATTFRPHEVSVDPLNLKVELTGDLLTYVGERRISQVRETYLFTFKLQRGALQLASFKLKGQSDD